MCTAIKAKSYFGRNMDIDKDYNQKVLIIPRDYLITFKIENIINKHYAIMGIGTLFQDYPLLADGINEYGLAYAALRFTLTDKYNEIVADKLNYAPYELPLIILSTCRNVSDAKGLLENINIVDIPFSNEMPNTPLHFMISDKNSSIVIELLNSKLCIYDNPYNALTNNPEFNYHVYNLSNYMTLHSGKAKNYINKRNDIKPLSYNSAAIGLPGDYSSQSRFIKAYYVKSNTIIRNNDLGIIEFFKCLSSVEMPKGCVETERGFEYTYYSNCYDLKNNILYYKTYYSSIYSINLNNFDLNTSNIISYNLKQELDIKKHTNEKREFDV